MTTKPPTRVDAAPSFDRAAKQLRKKYRHVGRDIEAFIQQLEQGETPGDRLQRIKHVVYKARVANTDAQRGKSGGYRVIYYIKRGDSTILIYMYSKSDQEDVDETFIETLIDEYEAAQAEPPEAE
jgi:mRNA-degrading endonuclease RelE of RelBE toxin-antitoxin system